MQALIRILVAKWIGTSLIHSSQSNTTSFPNIMHIQAFFANHSIIQLSPSQYFLSSYKHIIALLKFNIILISSLSKHLICFQYFRIKSPLVKTIQIGIQLYHGDTYIMYIKRTECFCVPSLCLALVSISFTFILVSFSSFLIQDRCDSRGSQD